MSTKTKTTNQMIFATITTKKDRNAKYADQLRELGYTVEPGDEYWSVDRLKVINYGKLEVRLRGYWVEGKQNIAKIDFEDFLKKYDERAEKDYCFDDIDDGKIFQRRFHKVMHCYRGYGKSRMEYKRRRLDTHDVNRVVAEYRQLRRKAECGAEHTWGYNSTADVQKHIDSQLEKIEKLQKQLKAAQERLAELYGELNEAQIRKFDGVRELDDFLREHGVR